MMQKQLPCDRPLNIVVGTGMSPFGRYPTTFGAPNPNFPGLSGFPPSREMPPLGGLGSVHDPWRGYVSIFNV